MRNRLTLFILTLSLLWTGLVLAKEEPVDPWFGPEFTFSSQEIWQFYVANRFDYSKIMNAVQTMIEHAENRSAKRHSVGFGQPESFVNFLIDQGVVEVNAQPQTAEFFRQNAALYESLIFDGAKAAHVHPMTKLGGGHIHIGRVFHNNPQLLRDFAVDFLNHPALSMGILGYNPKNATHIADMDPRNQLQFLKMVRDFDEAKLNGRGWSSEFFAEEFHRTAQKSAAHPFRGHLPYEGKAFALNLLNLFSQTRKGSDLLHTAEVRAIAPQKNFAEFLKIITLFKARLNYLALNPGQQVKFVSGPLNFREAQAQFKTYVEECGLRWEDYQSFAQADWAADPARQMRKDPFDLYEYSLDERHAFMAEYQKLQQQPLIKKSNLLESCLKILLPSERAN